MKGKVDNSTKPMCAVAPSCNKEGADTARVRWWLPLLLLVAALALSGCSLHQSSSGKAGSASYGKRGFKPYTIRGKTYYPLQSAHGFKEEGIASWYGSDFHGKATASGERYDMYGMTAAHKTLPLGTQVRVTNKRNGRSILVCINDRGPFIDDRVIDLTHTGAKQLGMLGPGTAHVVVEHVPSGADTPAPAPYVPPAPVAPRPMPEPGPMVAQTPGAQSYGTQEYPDQRSGGRPVPAPVYGSSRTTVYGTTAGTTVQNPGQADSPASYRTAATQGQGQFFAQIGAFSVQNNAERLCEKIRQTGVPARSQYDSHKGLWRVQVGPYRSMGEANQAAATVRNSPTLLSSMNR